MKKQNVFFNSNIWDSACFVLFLLGCFYLFHWSEILFMGPTGIHVWRQTDSLTIVQNYYYDGQSFFEPRNSDFRYDAYDITLTEFPIYYYISAWCWKFFGESYFILRLLHLSTFLLGIWGLFRLAQLYLQQNLLSLLVVGALLSSPILVLYVPSFLPNVPALGLTFYAWYLLVRYYRENKFRLFGWAIALLTLACLLKVTLISNLLIVLFLSWYIFRKDKQKYKFRKHLSYSLTGMLIVYLWLLYLQFYNHESAAASLFSSFSVFANPWEEIVDIWNNGFKYNLFLLEHSCFWIFFLLLFAWNLFSILRNKHWILFWIHFLTTGSALVYFLLFFISFHNHEYYLLDFIPMIALHLLTGIYYLSLLRGRIIYVPIGLLLLSYSLWLASAHITTSYVDVEAGMALKQRLSMDEKVSDFNRYYRYDSSLRDPLIHYRGQLRKLGINRKNKVVCMPDQSPNTLLFYYNLRGISNFHLGWKLDHLKQLLRNKEKKGYSHFIYAKKLDLKLDSLVSAQLPVPEWQDERVAVYNLKKLK